MQTFDDKVDAAVHAAFMALGLPVGTHMELAYRLNDFITQEFRFHVTGDDDEDAPDNAELPSLVTGPGGRSDD